MKDTTLFAALVVAGGSLHAQTIDPGLSLITMQAPSVNDEIAELGQMLFFDARLSGDSSTSCADCHSPDYGWSDGAELSRGYPGTKHWRNSQTIVNVGYLNGGFHWDSGLDSLNDQVLDAMGAGFVANIDVILAEERLRQIPEYIARFDAVWGETPSMARIAEAIAAFESSLVSNDSPFDRYMAGQTNAMSEQALRGMELFNGKANCSSCHSGRMITDAQFHNVSVPPNPAMAEDPLRQVTFRYLMRNLGVAPEIYAALDRDPGRYLSTKDPEDLGKLRTPPLRYLKYTAPYMHNGVFYTLDEVVDFYNLGGTQDVFGTKSPLIQPLGLNQDEKSALVAFLESLSGSEIQIEAPALPAYATLAFPSVRATLNAASLTNDLETSEQSIAGAAPSASAGIQLLPRNNNSSGGGLTLTPRATTAAPQPAQPGGPEQIKLIGGSRYVLVMPGDTLGDLASLIYGDPTQYTQLFEANRQTLDSPNDLQEGMLLRIP